MTAVYLVALDGSQQADKVVRKAVVEAQRSEARLILFRVLETPDYLFEVTGYPKIIQKTYDFLEEALADLQQELKQQYPELEVSYYLQEGKPTRCIQQFAADVEPVDRIIMGITGESEQNLTGSTTAYIVNHAPCDVLVVK